MNEFWKQRSREAQNAAVGKRATCDRVLLHPRKWQCSGHIANFAGKCNDLAGKLPSPLEFTLKQDEHGIGRIALLRIDLPSLKGDFSRLAEEPGNLILG